MAGVLKVGVVELFGISLCRSDDLPLVFCTVLNVGIDWFESEYEELQEEQPVNHRGSVQTSRKSVSLVQGK